MIEYIRTPEGKIDGFQVGERFIPKIKGWAKGLCASDTYTLDEISKVVNSQILRGTEHYISLFIDKDGMLFVGGDSFRLEAISSQIYGYITCLREMAK